MRFGFVWGVKRQTFCCILFCLPNTGSRIPGQGISPNLRFPMRPVGTIGIHSWIGGWQPKTFDGRSHALYSAKGTKALPLTMGPSGPYRTWTLNHTCAWQPGQMSNRTGEVGGPPGSRRLFTLIPVIPAQGPLNLGRAKGGWKP